MAFIQTYFSCIVELESSTKTPATNCFIEAVKQIFFLQKIK